jgi:hypothetical protein
MKNLLVLLLFFTVQPVTAQLYQPLIRTGIYWEQFWWGPSICNTTGAHRVFFNGDTLVNGLTYATIYENPIVPLILPGPFCAPFGVDTSLVGLNTWLAIREDSVTQQVLIYDFNEGAEFLLFDFSLQAGDTFVSPHTTYGNPFVIDSIKTITTNDGISRRMFFGTFPIAMQSKWILEGIGSSSGLYLPIMDAIGGGSSLNCVLDHTTPLLPITPPFNWNICTQILATEDNLDKPLVTIGPNPTTGTIQLSHSFASPCMLQVYDRCGRRVFTVPIDQSVSEVRLPDLITGMYFVAITSAGNRIYVDKLVVARED